MQTNLEKKEIHHKYIIGKKKKQKPQSIKLLPKQGCLNVIPDEALYN